MLRRRVLLEESDCWLCGKAVDKTLHHHDPGAPEVDEIVPASLGGNPLDRANVRLAHRLCNERRGNGTRGQPASKFGELTTSRNWSGTAPATPVLPRRVVLICGPSGAGKTTLARQIGGAVFDIDDPQWSSERQFRTQISQLPRFSGQAVVIRAGATRSARQSSASLIGADEVRVIATPLDECVRRIKERARPGIARQVAAAKQWWEKYEPDTGWGSPPD